MYTSLYCHVQGLVPTIISISFCNLFLSLDTHKFFAELIEGGKHLNLFESLSLPIATRSSFIMTTTVLSSSEAHSFDYLIVGGGTAGCVVASRLAEYLPEKRILLIEAGPSDFMNDKVLNLKDWLNLLGGELDYDYGTTEQPNGEQMALNLRVEICIMSIHVVALELRLRAAVVIDRDSVSCKTSTKIMNKNSNHSLTDP